MELVGRELRTVRRMVQYIQLELKSYDGTHLAFGGTLDRAAISNTSHSNKAGSTTVKRARLTGKGTRSTAVLP